jgi:hypothetical protein
MEVPRFYFDFSFLDIESLLAHYDNFGHEEEFEYMIGFSVKNKFLAFTFTLSTWSLFIRTVRHSGLSLDKQLSIK